MAEVPTQPSAFLFIIVLEIFARESSQETKLKTLQRTEGVWLFLFAGMIIYCKLPKVPLYTLRIGF